MWSVIGWLFLIASWIVPKYIFPNPGEERRRYMFAIALDVIAISFFLVGLFTHVHGPGCSH